MPLNPFIGRSREWLESELEIAQEDYSRGKTTASWGSEGQSGSKVVQMTPKERIEALLYALNLIDSITYPISSIRPVITTLGRFTYGSNP